MWDRKELHNTVREKLKDRLVVVASNREPYLHIQKGEIIQVVRPAGGAVTALDPVMRACGGIWVAHGSANADQKVVDEHSRIRVPPDDPQYTLRRVWLSKEEEDGYYYGFSNRALWPLCHIVYVRPIFDESDWQHYKRVNQKFARVILEEIGTRKAFVWIHDYHLTLLPRILKKARPDMVIAYFWHIPWPNPEAFRICPKKKEILEGLLASDLLGFHLRYHCRNFLSSVEQELECLIDRERTAVIRGNHSTLIRGFPIGVDFEAISQRSASAETEEIVERIKKEFVLGDKIVFFGLDRIDYTKGIPEKIKAIGRFLDKYHEYKKRIVFLQVGSLSRINIKEYQDINDEINAAVVEVNHRHSVGAWAPIIFTRRKFSHKEIIAFYRLADFCMVSSLHDGMNLVAKEYVAAKNGLDGALILSQFTGAAREMRDIILVNPYDVEEFAEGIKKALSLSEKERRRRMSRLRRVVAENNIYKWAGKYILELEKV